MGNPDKRNKARYKKKRTRRFGNKPFDTQENQVDPIASSFTENLDAELQAANLEPCASVDLNENTAIIQTVTLS